MTEPMDNPADGDAELGPGSLWFLRIVSVIVILVLLWFLVDAIIG